MNYVLIIDGKLSNEWESYVFEGQSPISCIPSSNSLLTKSTSWYNPSTLFARWQHELLVYSGWCDLNSSIRNSSSQLESPLELLPCDTCLSNVAVCVFSYRWISTWHFSWCPRQPGVAAVNPRWGGAAGEKKSKIETYLSCRPPRSSPAPLHCFRPDDTTFPMGTGSQPSPNLSASPSMRETLGLGKTGPFYAPAGSWSLFPWALGYL